MKNILLVNPWIADFAAYDLWARPLGLLELAGRLRAHPNLALDFLDCLNMHHPAVAHAFRQRRPDGTGKIFGWRIAKPEALQALKVPRALKLYGIPEAAFAHDLERRPRPDAVLMTSGMTYQYPGVQRAIQLIGKRWAGVPVLLGGIYATLCADHARAFSGAATVLPGPAGMSLENALSSVLGMDILLNWPPGPPAFELLADTSSLPFLTTRGCPYHCTYCASHLLQPVSVRRPVGECLEDLRWIRRDFPTRHIAFYDDALLLDADRHTKPLLEGIIREGFDFTFHTPNGLHVREIDAELAVLMKKARIGTVRLSVETTSPRLLKRTDSEHKKTDLSQAVRHLEAAGYRRHELDSYLLIGLPGQTKEELEESAKHAAAIGIRSHFSYFSPIPGTPLWKEMAASGLVRDQEDPLLNNKALFPYRGWSITPEELDELKAIQNRLNGSLVRRLPSEPGMEIKGAPVLMSMKPTTAPSGTIDEYISGFADDVRTRLEKIRQTVRKASPGAVEAIVYRMPTFRLNGNLVHFAAFKNHIGFYPTPSGVVNFKRELAPYVTSKGAIQFPLDRPVPYALITRIVKFRVKENTAKAKAGKAKR